MVSLTSNVSHKSSKIFDSTQDTGVCLEMIYFAIKQKLHYKKTRPYGNQNYSGRVLFIFRL